MSGGVHKQGDPCPRCGHWAGVGGKLTLRQGNPGTHLAGRLFLACSRPTQGDFCFHSYAHPYAWSAGPNPHIVTLSTALLGHNGVKQ